MNMRITTLLGLVLLSVTGACSRQPGTDPTAYEDYEIVSTGTRQFEWDTDSGPGRIKVLVEKKNLGSAGVEVAEILFPPGWQGQPHTHDLEIIYVIEGELEHIINGVSYRLEPGMTGTVRARDSVVHKTPEGVSARVLVVWPLGGEVDGFAASGMRETAIGQ
jgi:mannose-6-phosphate isomerase-like protein (cupin superfamily)